MLRSAHTDCIYVFCVDLRTNSDYFPIQRLVGAGVAQSVQWLGYRLIRGKSQKFVPLLGRPDWPRRGIVWLGRAAHLLAVPRAAVQNARSCTSALSFARCNVTVPCLQHSLTGCSSPDTVCVLHGTSCNCYSPDTVCVLRGTSCNYQYFTYTQFRSVLISERWGSQHRNQCDGMP